MLRAVATVGYLGCLPRLGGLLSAALGLALAVAVFLATFSGAWVLSAWFFAFAATAWALPRALDSAAVDDDTITIDRFVGIWVAAAPVIPVTALAVEAGAPALALLLGLPLAAYHLLLAGPLHRLGQSRRPVFRIGDDLIAALGAMLAALGGAALVLSRFADGGLL